MKRLRNLALAGLLTLAAAPSWAQWIPGTGDDFEGTALDKSVWGFNIPFPDATPPTVVDTEKPSLYDVSGGSLNYHSVNADNGYNPLYRGFITDTNGKTYANFATFTVASAPANGWFVETAFSLDETTQQSSGYPIFGILLLQNASQFVEWELTHFGFAAGNGPINAGNFTLLHKVGPQREDYHEGPISGGGFFFSPYDATDIYTVRVEYFPASDPGGERVDFSRKIDGVSPQDWTVVGSTTAADPDPLISGTFTLLSNPVGLQIGPHAGSQGATEENNVAFHYFHTNLTAATAGATVTGKIALEGVSDLSTISAGAPLGTFHVSFRMPNTTTEVYGKDVPLTPIGAGNASGTYSVSGVPTGIYDVAIKGGKNLRAAVASNLTVSGATTLPDALLPAGDADNNNAVDIGDFGILVNAYTGDFTVTGSGYDPAADFNFDGKNDIGDFGLLVNNFGSVGVP